MTTLPTKQAVLPGLKVVDLATVDGPLVAGPRRLGQADVLYRDVREILTRATGFMEEYDFTLNPYSGCTFGCTYCYAAFFGKTKGDRDLWGFRVTVKKNAVELLSRRKTGSLDGKRIYISSVTDPYQPIERELRLTRRILEILARRHKPKLVIQTRSPDVVRDLDLFKEIKERGGDVQVNMTVTTDDETVRRTFEPFCPSNSHRLRSVAKIWAGGVDACITMTPLLWVNDPEEFAEALLRTGVQKFIAQPFHFQRGKFVASTRDKAVDLMVKKLRCSRSSFRERYLDHYQRAYEVLHDTLPELGEGKDGFKPPF